MTVKNELGEIRRGLENIEDELSRNKAFLDEHFSKEEQVILRYEASIGRNGTRLAEYEGEKLKQYAAASQEYMKFIKEVDACLAGEMSQATAIWVGSIPDILRDVGCGEMDMYITQKHLRNILRNPLEKENSMEHYHGIEIQQMKQLPELLSNPFVVVSAKDRQETIIAILDAKDNQKNQLIVPVKKNGHAFYQGNRVGANFILSVYGKGNLNHYLEIADVENRILFIDKNISTNLGGKPLQLRQFLSTGTYINSIPNLKEKVNIPDIKNTAEKDKKVTKNLTRKL